jgi:hypothetical protein
LSRSALSLLRHTGLLALLSAWPAGVARADDAHDRASRAYEDARKAFEGGAYQAAAVAFERVFDAVANGASMVAASRAWEKAGEPALAADDLATSLTVGDLGAQEAKKAKQHLDLLETDLGRVHVTGPDGTTLTSSHARAMRTPADVHARVGSLTVAAVLPDGSRMAREVEVTPGGVVNVDLHATVAPPAAPPLTDSKGDESPSTSRPLRTAAWVTGGAALAAGIAAGALAPIFKSKNDDWASSARTDGGQRSSVVSLQIATDTAFLSACGLAATSTVLFLLSAQPSPKRSAASAGTHVSVGPGWVGLTGRFE